MGGMIPYVSTAELERFAKKFGIAEKWAESGLLWVTAAAEPSALAWSGDSADDYDRRVGYRDR